MPLRSLRPRAKAPHQVGRRDFGVSPPPPPTDSQTHSDIRRNARLKLKLMVVVEVGGSSSSISQRPIATRSCDGVYRE